MGSTRFRAQADRMTMSGTLDVPLSRSWSIAVPFAPVIDQAAGDWWKSGVFAVADDRAHTLLHIWVDNNNYIIVHKASSSFGNNLYVGAISGGTDRRASISAANVLTAMNLRTDGRHMLVARARRTHAAYLLEVFLNGSLIGSYSTNHTPTDLSSATVAIGNWTSGSGISDSSNGSSSDIGPQVGIWVDHFLTDGEVQALSGGASMLELPSRPVRVAQVDQVTQASSGVFSTFDRIAPSVSYTVAGTSRRALGWRMRDSFPEITRSQTPGVSKAIERLVEFASRVAGSQVFVFDQASGATVVPAMLGAMAGTASGITFGSPGFLPGERRTCGRFAGAGSLQLAANTLLDFNLTANYTVHAIAEIPATLADGDYSLWCHWDPTTVAGQQMLMTKSAAGGGLNMRHYVGSNFGSSSYVQQATAFGTVPTDRPTLLTWQQAGASPLPTGNLRMAIDGKRVASSQSGGGSTLATSPTTVAAYLTTPTQIGRNCAASPVQHFTGKLHAIALIPALQSWEEIATLGSLVRGDVPDIHVRNAKGEVFRPGDPGYGANLNVFMSGDFVPDEGEFQEIAAGAMERGECNIRAWMVGQLDEQDEAAIVPAAINRVFKRNIPIGVYRGGEASESPYPTKEITDAIKADPVLSAGKPAANAAYPSTLSVFMAEAAKLPDKGAWWIEGGDARVLAEILGNAPARALFIAKCVGVSWTHGAFNPSTDGTVWDSTAHGDGDAEYNVKTAPVAAKYVHDQFGAADMAGVQMLCPNWTTSVFDKAFVNAPCAGRSFIDLPSSVAKTSLAAKSNTVGRPDWDPLGLDLVLHGFKRVVTGGGHDCLLRGSCTVNDVANSPTPSKPAGYTLFNHTPGVGNVFVPVANWGGSINPKRIMIAHMERFVTGAYQSEQAGGEGIVGEVESELVGKGLVSERVVR